jgi:VWFA-related protein
VAGHLPIAVLATTAVICAAPAGFLAAQGDAPAPLVRINAVITDAAGRPIPKLSARDLDLREDGDVVPIDSVALTSAAGIHDIDARGAPAGDVRAGVGPATRAFAIVLDEFHVTPGAATERVRDALAHFVREQLSDDDLAVVFKPLDSLGAIRLTRDRDSIMRAIATFSGRKGDYEPRTAFERNYVGHAPGAIDAMRTQVVLSALRSIATQLGETRVATSTILLVSEGFTADERGRGLDPRLPDLTAVVRSAIRFGIPIYAFDPQDPVRLQPARLNAGTPDEDGARATLRRVTGGTGGELVPDGADLPAGLERMARDLTSRYTVTFTSPHGRDAKYHAIEIRVKRRGARVLAPAGYWAALPIEPRRALSVMPPPFASGRMLHRSSIIDAWVGITRQADGTARMLITWEPSRRTRGAPAVGIITLTATTTDGRVLFTGDVAARRPAGESGAAADRAAFDAPAGRVQLDMKIVADDGHVLDNDARDVDVPDLRTERKVLITTEIIRTASAREFRLVSADANAAPAAGREFSRTERLLIRVPAYDPGGGPPRVSVKLLNRWGQTLRDVAPMPDAPGPAQFDLPLAAFAPGDYILHVAAAGAAGETKEAINVRVTQ